jgi:hypothetical protein
VIIKRTRKSGADGNLRQTGWNLEGYSDVQTFCSQNPQKLENQIFFHIFLRSSPLTFTWLIFPLELL